MRRSTCPDVCVLLTRSELNWLYQEGGAANVFPEYYKDFQKRIPKGERGDMVKAYYKRLTTGSEEVWRCLGNFNLGIFRQNDGNCPV